MRCDTDKVIKKSSLVADLRRVASDKGFVISDNAACGNCTFYSLTEQLKRVKDIAISHGELRRTLVRFLREHSNLVSYYKYDICFYLNKDGERGRALIAICCVGEV